MMIKIECRCGHVGVASAKRLPREFRCSSCGASSRVEPDGDARIVSTERRIERVNAILAAAR
jgi:hypothetical protein